MELWEAVLGGTEIDPRAREKALSEDSASLRGKASSVKSAAPDTRQEPLSTEKANRFGPKTPQILPFR